MAHLYSIDEEKLTRVRQQKLWMNDPKYFKRVKVSPSAAIKMIMHGQQGVDRGTKQNGKPIEVMGLLLGRPDTEDLSALVITDCQALPIEGFETKVIADDEDVINYMIELGDALEISRKERFCGWYHTHPFDVDTHGHCFLSNTDLSTQLQWQRAEDGHGNPWVAIVIDPLYSLAKGRPEMMAFRVYPPEFNPPANETPDGAIVTDDKTRVELWGACWNRYYKLQMEYFMSPLSQSTLGVLKNKFLWDNAFTSHSALQTGQKGGLANDVRLASAKLQQLNNRAGHVMEISDLLQQPLSQPQQQQQQQQQQHYENEVESASNNADRSKDRNPDKIVREAARPSAQLLMLSSNLLTDTTSSVATAGGARTGAAVGGGAGGGGGAIGTSAEAGSGTGVNISAGGSWQSAGGKKDGGGMDAKKVGVAVTQALTQLSIKNEIFGRNSTNTNTRTTTAAATDAAMSTN